jgi:hypothetical protein
MEQRVYTPLNAAHRELRLLAVKAGKRDDAIKCTMGIHALSTDAAPIYETISYAWGDHNARGSILLNGTTLDVPANTVAALRCMRFRHRERTLWIDSVCINQWDIHERGQQVAMMAEIFQSSSANLVYVGENCGMARCAFASIELLVQEAESELDGEPMEDVLCDELGDWRYSSTPLSSGPDFEALTWLYSLSWFR